MGLKMLNFCRTVIQKIEPSHVDTCFATKKQGCGIDYPYMENADVAVSDKARSSEHYSEMDRESATQNDISQRGSSPSGKAMDRQREAQEYIRNRRAQATVADEADENVMVNNVSQFGPQNISTESEDDEQKLLITLAEKYNYNLYLTNDDFKAPGELWKSHNRAY
ncbi:predicted protein [Sclerotinia sclerotiorum 1980 UF-70]|uniref:Uncharacterized protein n=1 Tax=Sclerotinia sclerotiorum (strain ATCC 18683 / 1980 / Ss-1) TaxID=665079 RepID=A7EG55_SCLS1|nr:predicted protein [Sclerotinia sclerotiorum 1980 UF-70]EDO01821.1 predicted protein [Sclerotinia sclerotiorum 1980 UF-70]